MDDEDSDSDVSIESQDGVDDSDPFVLCGWFCDSLSFHHRVKDTAQSFMTPLSQMLERRSRSPRCIAAVSIYIAMHLLNFQIHEVADHVARLARISESEERIRSTWRLIYADRMELVVPALLPELAKLHMDNILALLPARLSTPLFGHMIAINGEPHVPDEERFEILQQLSERLRDPDLLDSVAYMSEKFVDNMWLMFNVEDMSIFTERACEAVSTYMACYLLGVPISSSYTARVYKISERTLCQMYAQVYPRRSEIMSSRLVQTLGNHNLHRILHVLPALNWPPS